MLKDKERQSIIDYWRSIKKKDESYDAIEDIVTFWDNTSKDKRIKLLRAANEDDMIYSNKDYCDLPHTVAEKVLKIFSLHLNEIKQGLERYNWDSKLSVGDNVKFVTRKNRRFTAIKGKVKNFKNGNLIIMGKDNKEYNRKKPQKVWTINEILLEFPHVDNEHFEISDLRIEKYPISKEEKQELAKEYNNHGITGFLPKFKIWLLFSNGRVDITKAPKEFKQLPQFWYKYALTEQKEFKIKNKRYDYSKFDQEQLKAGTKEEFEHTKNKKIAMQVAADHLTSDKNYYKKLKKYNINEIFSISMKDLI